MRRSRRRMLGLTAAVAVHLLAGLSLTPVARPYVQAAAHPSDASAPVTVVQFIHLRPQEASVAAQPASAPKSKPISLPEPAAPFEAALSDPDMAGPSEPRRPEDEDLLYRVPFRDAVAQAGARLRAGLDCAHVDLPQLPKTVFDLCAAAEKLKEASPFRGPKDGPLG